MTESDHKYHNVFKTYIPDKLQKIRSNLLDRFPGQVISYLPIEKTRRFLFSVEISQDDISIHLYDTRYCYSIINHDLKSIYKMSINQSDKDCTTDYLIQFITKFLALIKPIDDINFHSWPEKTKNQKFDENLSHIGAFFKTYASHFPLPRIFYDLFH